MFDDESAVDNDSYRYFCQQKCRCRLRHILFKFAAYTMLGYRLDGYRIRCEFAKGGKSGMAGVGGSRGPQKSEFRVKITELPPQTSWQVGRIFMAQE